jgi:hypothetical protein
MRGDALDALALGAELVVVHDLGQARDAVGISDFLRSWSKKNLASARRGRTTRSLPPITAEGIGRADVADDEELVGELSRGVEQRKILLVGLHGQDQAFLRHIEEFLFEGTNQHVGPFDQCGDFVEQGLIIDGREAFLRGGGLELLLDLGAARSEAGDHGAFAFELLRVGIRILDRYDRIRGLEAVALGLAAGHESEYRDRHDIGAMQRDQLVRGTDEIHAAPAVGELVAHHLGYRQRRQRGFERRLQAFGQRRAGHHGCRGTGPRPCRPAGASVWVPRKHPPPMRQASSAAPASRWPFGVERHGDRHQLLLHLPVGGFRGDGGNMHGKAARRGKGR